MTLISLLPRLGAFIAGIVLAVTAAARNRLAAPAGPAAATNAPAIAERADQLFKGGAAYTGSPDQFTSHADVTSDHVLDIP